MKSDKIERILKMLEETAEKLKADHTEKDIIDILNIIIRYVEDEYFLCPNCRKEAYIIGENFCGKVILGCYNCSEVWTKFRK